MNQPDYRKLYLDVINIKFPDRMSECEFFFSKDNLSGLDIINMNQIIFGKNKNNQKHKSYDKETIFEILEFQKMNKLNNTQLAKKFKLSRNTIAKWKKTYFSRQE